MQACKALYSKEMASRMIARFASRRFSSGGKMLSEEEKAAENIYIKAISISFFHNRYFFQFDRNILRLLAFGLYVLSLVVRCMSFM